MKFKRISFVIVLCLCVISFLEIRATEERQSRIYQVGQDIGFRWRTTLNIKCGSVFIDSDAVHSDLKRNVAGCPVDFARNNANIAAASLQLVFANSVSNPVPILAEIYTANTASDYKQGEKTQCFSTACLEIRNNGNVRYPPITYRNRETLDLFIPYLFKNIEMKDDCIKNGCQSRFKYNYRDTELQVIYELFAEEYQNKMRKLSKRIPRFSEIFTSSLGNRKTEDVKLIILHIHTKFDPCAVCAEMLCKLSQTLNYFPKNLIVDSKLCNQLQLQLQLHQAQFLIEVSSDTSYWNARESSLDQFYIKQLSDTSKLGKHPIEILADRRFPPFPQQGFLISNITDSMSPLNYFSPFVVFKRMELPIIFKCCSGLVEKDDHYGVENASEEYKQMPNEEYPNEEGELYC